MSQILTPLSNGSAQIQTSSTFQQGVNLSPQYVAVNRLSPQPTEWDSSGRPIYDRLPSASERYKLFFGYEDDSSFIYSPPGSASTGVGTCQVTESGDKKFLVIQSGKLVWKYGSLDVNSVIIDLQAMNMVNTKYLLAYQLVYEDSPIISPYSVEEFSLSGQDLLVSSGTDSVTGWRYTPKFAFTGDSRRSWRNYDGFFSSYSGDAHLSWQSPYSSSYSRILLRCPPGTSISGAATLYYMLCDEELEENQYCTSPQWTEVTSTSVKKDSIGQYFEFSLATPIAQRGWKISWEDSKVSVYDIRVSGTITLKRKPATAFTTYQLVAYPENSFPKRITNLGGDVVESSFCKLASVDIDQSFRVQRIRDLRETANNEYQPIADWLTLPWDDNLKEMYEQVKDYSRLWMSPSECLYQEYLGLQEQSITVEV